MFEHANPDDPWLTRDAIKLLKSMLQESDRGVEFGSGRSTIWFAERVRQLTSVEHDDKWYATVSSKLKERELSNVAYIFEPQDQPAALGYMSAYAQTALTFPDASIDFALVDGIYRNYTAKLILPKIKSGGLLIIDNVNWFLPSSSHAPSSRTLAAGPDGPVWSEVAQVLGDWRTIWTTSGVCDTAIFIKP